MTHDVRTRCTTCGDWFWAGDEHTCTASNLYLDAAMVAAWPEHDRMVTAHADSFARQAATAYRARIADEDAYWAGMYGLKLTGRAA